MKQQKFDEILKTLRFTEHAFNGLICLFSRKDNSLLQLNRDRALNMADTVIEAMQELKEIIRKDNGLE